MNVLDPDVLLRVVHYMNMFDIAQLRTTCKSNRYLFSSYNSVIGQALVNQYGASKGVDVAIIHCHQKVVLWICRNFTNQLDWVMISGYPILSEAFIREFKDKVYWVNISGYQKLSEAFIREFQNSVLWLWISGNQELSEAFREEFRNRLP